jgi:hypothetical protein
MSFPFDATPSLVWQLTLGDKHASCEVRFVPIGVEVRVLRNGTLLWSRIFESGEDALNEAEDERLRMLSEGWQE